MESASFEQPWSAARREPVGVRRTLLALFAAGVAVDVSVGTWLGAGGRQSLVSSLVLGLPLVLAGAWHFLTGGGFRRVPPALTTVAAFVAWSAMSVFWATQHDDSAQVATVTRVQLLAVLWLGYQLVRTERDLERLVAGYLAGGALLAALAWRAHLFGAYDPWGRIAADGFDPNDMSLYLALGIPMAGYLATGPGRARGLSLLYVPVAISGIVLSGSRTGVIAAGLAVPATLVWLAIRSPRRAALALAVLVVGAAVAAPRIPQSSVERILTLRDETEDVSANGRSGIWAAALDVFPAHFVAGVGVGGFAEAVASLTGERILAHNTTLSVAVELGLVGVLLFFGAFGLALHRSRRGGPDAQVLVWSLIGLCLLGMQSLSWEHRKPLWLVLLVALAAGELRRTPAET